MSDSPLIIESLPTTVATGCAECARLRAELAQVKDDLGVSQIAREHLCANLRQVQDEVRDQKAKQAACVAELVSMELTAKSLKVELDRVRLDGEKYNAFRDCRAKLQQAQEAIGLVTTCAPDMEINVNDPVGMMQEVCRRFQQAQENLQESREDLTETIAYRDKYMREATKAHERVDLLESRLRLADKMIRTLAEDVVDDE